MENNDQANLPDVIERRKILPDTIKKNIVSTIFYNCILFIIMMIITLIINVSFNELYIKDFDTYIDIIQMFCGIISVVVLEVAYRKDSGKIGLYGIEFLIFSICILFVPYMYIFKSNIEFLKDVINIFAIYYFSKSLIEVLHTRNKYLRENMSDIKELVKEEKESYIDEESTKTLKEQKIEEEKKKKAKEEKAKNKKKNNKNENKNKDKQEKKNNDKVYNKEKSNNKNQSKKENNKSDNKSQFKKESENSNNKNQVKQANNKSNNKKDSKEKK